MNRFVLLLGLLLGVLSLAHAEPKAYDLVPYHGKVAGITVAFDFASGYPEASALKVTEASGKTTKFQLDNMDTMTFVPEKSGGASRSISLKMEAYEFPPPAKVTGTYVAGGKTVEFTLVKGKRGK